MSSPETESSANEEPGFPDEYWLNQSVQPFNLDEENSSDDMFS